MRPGSLVARSVCGQPPRPPRPTARRRLSLRGGVGRLAASGLAGAGVGLAGVGLLGAAASPPPAPRGSARTGKFGSPERRVTDILLVANCAAFAAQVLTGQRLTVWGAKINAAIAAGELWRLLTPALLHGNLLHLATNNYALNSLGPLVERVSGRARFISVYTIAAITGTAASYAFTKAPSVGASGAIFGLGGALAVFFYRHKKYFGRASDAVLASLGQSLAINVAMGLVTANVDNWGHAGGLLGGALVAYLLGPRLVVDRPAKGPAVAYDRPPVGLLAGAPITVGGQ